MHIEKSLELYRILILCRYAEVAIQREYGDDEMKTPMHMSMGSEAIAAGVCAALGSNSFVFGTYRSHALYLSKTGDTDGFFAEMYGKETGGAKGKSGSMHLSNPEKGFMGASAIVGAIIPVAVGFAFSRIYRKLGGITAVFFGDGATDEGAFWESFNLACVKQIPMLFICEDNGLAMFTSSSERHGYNNIANVLRQFNCSVHTSESTDVETIYSLISSVVGEMKSTSRPCFIQLKYYRYLEHVGVAQDLEEEYRSKEEYEEWYRKDPILVQRRKLLSLGMSEEDIVKMEIDVTNQIYDSIEKAKEAGFANVSSIYEDIFDE